MDRYCLIMVHILEKAGLFGKFKTSTKNIGNELKLTQQTASRKLIEMESKKLIKREMTGSGVILSLDEKGREYLRKRYDILKKNFEKKFNVLKGNIKSGIGEGKYYVSQQQYLSQFKEKLGFKPYFGTLNLKVKEKKDVLEFINELQPILIDGFKTKERTYGPIACYKVKIKDKEGAIAIPERTRHEERIIEIISPVYLRGYYNLKDNDILEVQK